MPEKQTQLKKKLFMAFKNVSASLITYLNLAYLNKHEKSNNEKPETQTQTQLKKLYTAF